MIYHLECTVPSESHGKHFHPKNLRVRVQISRNGVVPNLDLFVYYLLYYYYLFIHYCSLQASICGLWQKFVPNRIFYSCLPWTICFTMSLINMSTIVIFIGNCATSIFFCFLWAQSHFFAWHKIQSIMMIPILMILTLMISTVMMIMILTIMMISTNVMRHPEQFSPTGGSNLRVNQHLVEGKSAKMVYFPFFQN